MKFLVEKKFLVGKIEDKGTVNLYTLLDVETFEKFVSVGTKGIENIKEREIVVVEIEIRITPERMELKNGEKRFMDVSKKFITSVEKVKNNAK